LPHQRDQRRHDDGEAVANKRRKLVAQRLAAAGRHHREHVAAVEDRRDDVGLTGPERREPEYRVKAVLRGCEIGHGCRCRPRRRRSIFVPNALQACYASPSAAVRFLAA
jgi:hypothetical protein